MIRSKTFVRKTKKGNIVKVVREHYLRDDVWCGCASCSICNQSDPVLESSPANDGTFLCLPNHQPLPSHYLLPDTNVMLHQMDVIEHHSIQNVIVLQTVLDEVRHQSLGLYQRLRAIIVNSKKKFFVFLNEHRRETYIERSGSESSNDRNDRAIRVACAWYNAHLASVGLKAILLTNDRGNLERAKTANIPAFTVHEYIKSGNNQDLIDLLAFADSSLESYNADNISDPFYSKLHYNFKEHLPASQLLTSVKLGKLHQGVLQVNRDNHMEGTVRVKAFSSAVLIRGRKAMNRAMQDDVVVIKILPKSQWLTPSTQLALDEEEGNDNDDDDGGGDGNDNNDGNDNDEETNTTNNNNNNNSNNNNNKSGGSTNSGKGQSSKKSTEGDDEEGGEEGDSADSTSNQDIDAETLESAVAEEAATIDESVDASLELYTRKSKKDNNSNNTEQTTTTTGLDNDAESEKRPTGVVVGILKRTWKPCTGMLVSYPEFFSSVPMDTTNVSNNNKSDSSDNEKTATRMIFIPTDTRFPKVRVQTLRPSAFENQRVLITIDRWSKFSKYPEGHIVKSLGTVGEKSTETAVLLIEHEVRHAPFSEAVLADLPTLPWVITEQDRAIRRDFRHLDICSVDPPGCTDIDDALHVRELPNGNYEIGVHIADVSHFVKANTAMDLEAARRGTTVYLTGRRIDMLPELLGTNLCSLMCNVERFAMSVLWEVTPPSGTRDGVEIVKTEYCRSIINSRASLTYAQAQAMIDDSSRTDVLAKGLRILNACAKILHQRRIDRGTLTLESQEISFSLDKDTSDPVDVGSKQLLETNSMVEEFMLLANVAVAEHIYKHFPQTAILRRHPTPPQASFEPLVVAAKQHGVDIRAGNSKELADSLDQAEDLFAKVGNAFLGKLLRILATRCMMQAVYFCSGTLPEREHGHYGLACPIYTHFTSPIRRYPDVLVHRLLAVAIGLEIPTKELLDKPKFAALTDNLNRRHRMAQYAQRASVELHTILFFKRLGQVQEEGYVLRIRENALVVLVPKYGIEGHILLPTPASAATTTTDTVISKLSSDGHRLTIQESGSQGKEFTFKVFDKVGIQVSVDTTNIQKQRVTIKLVSPFIKGLSVVVDNDATSTATTTTTSTGATGSTSTESTSETKGKGKGKGKSKTTTTAQKLQPADATSNNTSETLSRIIEQSLQEEDTLSAAQVVVDSFTSTSSTGQEKNPNNSNNKGKSAQKGVVMMGGSNVSSQQRRTADAAQLSSDSTKVVKKSRA